MAKKLDKGKAAIAVAAVGGAAVVVVLLSKNVGKVTVNVTPTSGLPGTVITVGGSGWKPSESITKVTVGGYNALYSLNVNTEGNISGSITIPQLTSGAKTLVITGAESGAQTFEKAFTVLKADWELMTSSPITLGISKIAGGGGWEVMTASPITLGISKIAGGGGWEVMTASPITLGVGRLTGYPLNVYVVPTGFAYVYKHPDKALYEYGEMVRLIAQPYWNAYLEYWEVNGFHQNPDPDQPNTLDIYISGEITVTAHFKNY
jgi:hypothetical protein